MVILSLVHTAMCLHLADKLLEFCSTGHSQQRCWPSLYPKAATAQLRLEAICGWGPCDEVLPNLPGAIQGYQRARSAVATAGLQICG